MIKAKERQAQLQKGIRRLESQRTRLEEISQTYTWLRLSVFGVFFVLVVALIVLRRDPLAWGALFIGLLSFSLLVKQHQKIRRSLYSYTLWIQFKQEDLARLNLDWDALPQKQGPEVPAQHPFARDLDIIGPRSLFRLLDTSLTQEGHSLLQNRLLQQTPDWKALQTQRQQIQELATRPYFRNRLRLAAFQAAGEYRHNVNERQGWSTTPLLEFLAQYQPQKNLRPVLNLLSACAGLNWLLYGLYFVGVLPAWSWQASLTVYILLFFQQKQVIQGLFKDAFQLDFQLYKLHAVLQYLEKAPMQNTPHLATLCQHLKEPGHTPSQLVKQLRRVLAAASLQSNPIAWAVVNLLGPWDFYFTLRLEQLKPQFKKRLPHWLHLLHELEALSALAHFAWLHPEYNWPEIHPTTSEPPHFSVTQLGHPLLNPEQKVNNDFSSLNRGEAFIITGSNMAGKSTFLKSLGVNLALAYAGTVVDAKHLTAPLFRIYTCIKVSDSVTDGLSYFYAEVKRLKSLLEALHSDHPYPLFFLIDEIFKGTNNRERLLGSRAYIRALTDKNGLGGISTHDLELIHLADHNPLISNYHFREQIQDKKMHFDYQLHSGPCPTTNALRIMEIEGLPVDSFYDEAP